MEIPSITDVDAYAKFFKDLVSIKGGFIDGERIVVSKMMNSLFVIHLQKKEEDPISFVVRLVMGNNKYTLGMIDLGDGVNLILFSIYK